MKWFNSLPEDDKKKFGVFFNSPECFPPEVQGKDLARLEKEDIIACLHPSLGAIRGRIIGASLYAELQLVKAKGVLIDCLRTTHTILFQRNLVVCFPIYS